MKSNLQLFLLALILLLATTRVFAAYDIKQLKKLFTNVQQRRHIDAMRRDKLNQLHKKKLNRVILRGYVKRSGGRNVIWINGKNTLKSNHIYGVKVNPESINDHDQVTLTIDGKRLKLKPGESWLRQNIKADEIKAP